MTGTDALRGVPLFGGMTERAIAAISGLTSEATFGDGSALVREGGPGESFMVLLSGSARVERGGRPIGELRSGDFLGEISLLDGGPRTATVTAVGDVRALIVERAAFRRLIEEFGSVRYEILSALTARIRRDASDSLL